MNLEPNSNFKYILSIDIGITHLGLVLVECTMDYIFNDIIWFELIDITKFHHLDFESKKKCKLYHTKTISDWLSHIMYLHTELFDLVEHILIERQPPQGYTAVEQLLYFQYRSKAFLISPRSVHKFFGWGTETYEERKLKSIEIIKFRIKRLWLQDYFQKIARQHDISDAFIQTIFFLCEKNLQFRKEKLIDCDDNGDLAFLNLFRFHEKTLLT